MIRVTFFYSGDELSGFLLDGHAGQGPEGTDIVCAAVSSAAYMAANTITEIMGVPADAKAEDGWIQLRIRSDTARCQELLKGLRLHLAELERQYPENLKVINGGAQNA